MTPAHVQYANPKYLLLKTLVVISPQKKYKIKKYLKHKKH